MASTASGVNSNSNQASHSSLLSKCASCGKTDQKLYLCAQCFFENYCGKDCQIAHRDKHKEVCAASVWGSIYRESKAWLDKKNNKTFESMFFLNKVVNSSYHPPSLLVESFSSKQEGKLAFDLGCGNGPSCFYLLERGWKVIAIDYSEDSLKLLEGRANAINKQWIESKQLIILHKDLNEYDFSEKAQLIVASDVFPYLDPRKLHSLWIKIYEALEENGHLISSLFDRGSTQAETWCVDGIDFVQRFLSESSYSVDSCRFRPKHYKSKVIEFMVHKPSSNH